MTLDEVLQLVQVKDATRRLLGAERSSEILFIQETLGEARPRGVDAIVWIAPPSWPLNKQNVSLLTFSRFRSAYTIIERMARILTPVALEHDIIPTIIPFDPKHLRGMTKDTPFVRRLERQGALVYR